MRYNGSRSHFIGINFKPGIVAEYVLSKRIAISAAYQFARYGLFGDEYGSPYYPYYTPNPPGYEFTYFASSNAVKISINWARGRFVSPQGKYQAVSFSTIFSTVKQRSGKTDSVNVIGDYTDYSVSYDFGRRRILYDQLILDYGWGMSFTFGEDFRSDYNLLQMQNLMDMFHVHLGLRYLVF